MANLKEKIKETDAEQCVTRKNRIQDSMYTHEIDMGYTPDVETPIKIEQPKNIKLTLWQRIKLKFGKEVIIK